MLHVGLTGAVASGKSAVAAKLAALGAVVIDADKLARQVVELGTPGLGAIKDTFGEDVLLPDGSLNRPALAAIVFSDEAQRAKLNAIVHPLVRAQAQKLRDAAPKQALVVEDIPLLVESGQAEKFDAVVVVQAPLEERMRRMVYDRGWTEADAKARIAAQATDEQRAAVADYLLDNSGSLAELEAQVESLYQQLAPTQE
ncbi:dephospho-CoA kinase [Glutamicibacter arilaitensis]|uniref:dephospho-CoA kinase n=1 Tax=Glutamicibacter arilaitensis TaxID=256701 RepID=UPI001866C5B5|nr:dephospho-CoA kinase [Glutamicibacter arilaitensis]